MVCRREVPRCARALAVSHDKHADRRGGQPLDLARSAAGDRLGAASPAEVCSKGPPPPTPRMVARREKQARAEGRLVLPVAAAGGNASVLSSASSSWAPCEDAASTAQCEGCLNGTLAALDRCMGFGQAYFPGNLQPFIASRGAFHRLSSALGAGRTVRRVCGEWGLSHDGALTMLAWMLRLPYGEALHRCGAYHFARAARADACDNVASGPAAVGGEGVGGGLERDCGGCGSGGVDGGGGGGGDGSNGGLVAVSGGLSGGPVVLLDRVKRPEDIPRSCWPHRASSATATVAAAVAAAPSGATGTGTSDTGTGTSSVGSRFSPGAAFGAVDEASWDGCFAAGLQVAARAFDLDTASRTPWWDRLRSQQHQLQQRLQERVQQKELWRGWGDAVDGGDGGGAFEPWAGAAGALDIYSMADCRHHPPGRAAAAAVANKKGAKLVPEAAPGALALTAAAAARVAGHPAAKLSWREFERRTSEARRLDPPRGHARGG